MRGQGSGGVGQWLECTLRWHVDCFLDVEGSSATIACAMYLGGCRLWKGIKAVLLDVRGGLQLKKRRAVVHGIRGREGGPRGVGMCLLRVVVVVPCLMKNYVEGATTL